MKNKRQTLIDFQHFLILDGQLDINNDEVIRNAEIFEKSIDNAQIESQNVSKNENINHDRKDCKCPNLCALGQDGKCSFCD